MNSTTLCPQCQTPLPAGHSGTLCPACLLQLGFESQAHAAEATTAAYRPKFVVPTPEELAARFPQLEILEQVGLGGMGVVYRARQRDLDRIVALKILRSDIEMDRNFADRFQREARAMARLNHPNIVTVYDFGRQDDLYYFLMEYIDGTNLRQVEQTGKLTPIQALAIVPQICTALQYAHEQGVVHRDIKPENILVLRDGRVKIADFGLAKLTGKPDDGHLTGTWQVMGTPHYMAPEQVEKPMTVDHRADIYSLGVVIYEMLTGELPIGRFPVPSRKVQIDARLDDVVMRALEKEPELRYQRATEVQTAVEHIQQTPKTTKAPRPPLPSDPEKLRQHVLGAVKLSSKSLIILGSVDLVAALICIFLPPLSIVFALSGLLSIWTGLQLRYCEDYHLTLAGCILLLIPSSLVYFIKLPFAIMALYVLWHDRAEHGFSNVPWRDGETRKAIIAIGPMVVNRLRQTWAVITSPDTPIIGPTRAFVRHPGFWISILFLFWTILWTVYCIATTAALIDVSDLHLPGLSGDREWLMSLAALTGGGCWLIGEVFMIRHARRWYAARMQQQVLPNCAGPRRALLICMLVTLLTGLLQISLPFYLDYLRNWNVPPHLRDVMGNAVLLEMGTLSILFSLMCGVSALLLGWRRVRWITMLLLLAAELFPVGVVVVISRNAVPPSPGLITLLPVLLAGPVLIWGLWGARAPRSNTGKIASSAAPISPPPTSPAAATP